MTRIRSFTCRGLGALFGALALLVFCTTADAKTSSLSFHPGFRLLGTANWILGHFYRDGKWVLHDLKSTNGTLVNGAPVGRSELRPGDRILLGDERLTID
jgi:hypothetical protein